MAITDRTVDLMRRLRIDVGGSADRAVRDLTRSWSRTWDAITPEWQAAMDDVAAAAASEGRWPSRRQLDRLERLSRAEQRTQLALSQLSTLTAATVTSTATTTITATAYAEPALMASQLPTFAAGAAAAAYAASVAPSALEAIAARTAEQITAVTYPISADATAAIRRNLISGIAAGDGPADVARRMVAQTEGLFNGGLTRAMNIARTEILSAYRTTSKYVHQENADVLRGWSWHASLDNRTCCGCWAMHGTMHPVDEDGPDDHQSGRCARMPVLKSWAELGFTGTEPPDISLNAEELFKRLPRTDKLTIMGPGRLGLMESGLVQWDELAHEVPNANWRRSFRPRSVRDLRAIADKRRR